jgi:integrase
MTRPRCFSGTAVPPTPKYRRHRASGQAVVTICGQDFYLGKYGTKASHIEYDRIIGEWLAAGRSLPSRADGTDYTVREIIARYWVFAETHYGKSRELINIKHSLRRLKELYGHTLARDFGPLALKAIRQRMIDDGLARNTINSRIGKIRRVFKWAASEELLPVAVHQGLKTVDGLLRGRTKARETPPVLPVADSIVDTTLPHLPPVADMVRLQRLIGCRPTELCEMRPCDIDGLRKTIPMIRGESWALASCNTTSRADDTNTTNVKIDAAKVPSTARAPSGWNCDSQPIADSNQCRSRTTSIPTAIPATGSSQIELRM